MSRRKRKRTEGRPRPAQRTRCSYCELNLGERVTAFCDLCKAPMCMTCAPPINHDCEMIRSRQPTSHPQPSSA